MITLADLNAALDNPWALFLIVVVTILIVALATEAAIRRLGLRRHLEPVERIDDVQDFMQQRREGWR